MKKNILSLKFLTTLTLMIIFSGCAASLYDKDMDGIDDKVDICLSTPHNTTVDKYGCAVDSDYDGVLDVYDMCPNTKFTDLVDSTGCKIEK